jgi:hypothetical protein
MNMKEQNAWKKNLFTKGRQEETFVGRLERDEEEGTSPNIIFC